MIIPGKIQPVYTMNDITQRVPFLTTEEILGSAKDEELQLCKLATGPDIFCSEKEYGPREVPIPITYDEARQLITKLGPGVYGSYGCVSLVITHEEITRFANKRLNHLTMGDTQEEPGDPTPYPQQKLPTVLMAHDDRLVHGYEDIGKEVNCHKDNVLKLYQNEGLPLFWSASKPYSTFYRLVSWVENRPGKKRETAKNFSNTNNTPEK